MSENEVAVITEDFPKFAEVVRFWTEVRALHGRDLYADGMLEGYAEAMINSGACSRAREYIEAMQTVANGKYEGVS